MDSTKEDLFRFSYNKYDVICPKQYAQFLEEVFIVDVYRLHLLRKGDLVLDLGAGTGDFCIAASKITGDNGRVIAIEPNHSDFELLRENICRNNCGNITPLNLGVGKERKEEQMQFRGKTFTFTVDTLASILAQLRIRNKVDFIKMDIEGFEADVIATSIQTVTNARIISIEFHGTKDAIHDALIRSEYEFIPVTTRYIYKQVVKNSFLHPYSLLKLSYQTLLANPSLIKQIFTGFNITNKFITGTYVKRKTQSDGG